MQIIINNQIVEIESSVILADVLASHGLDAPGMAVAVNNKLVPRNERSQYILRAGDRLLVIKAVCGG